MAPEPDTIWSKEYFELRQSITTNVSQWKQERAETHKENQRPGGGDPISSYMFKSPTNGIKFQYVQFYLLMFWSNSV